MSEGSALDDHQIAAVLMRLAQDRGDDKTFCPSEAARALDPENWRADARNTPCSRQPVSEGYSKRDAS